jgi:O-6-methylguanine DNA methyltransferase
MVIKISDTTQREMRAYSEFYQKVWRACASIPKGETRSYGWVARKIGRPAAARAVGQALAKNPFAPEIPCHRVIAKSGHLTGYSASGGLASKRRRLIQEGINPASLRFLVE